MKITSKQLRQMIREAVTVLQEEEYDCIKDYMRMGYSRQEAQKECRGSGNYAIPTALDADGDGVLRVSETKNQNAQDIMEGDVVDMFSGDQTKQNAVERIARALANRAEKMLDPDGDGGDIAVHVDHKLFLTPTGNEGDGPLSLAQVIYEDYVSGKAGDQDESLDSIIERISIDYFDEDIEYALAALGDDRFDGTQDQMMKTKEMAAQQDPIDMGTEMDFEKYLQGIESGKVAELDPYDDLAENNLNEAIMVPLTGIGESIKTETASYRWSRIAGLDYLSEEVDAKEGSEVEDQDED